MNNCICVAKWKDEHDILVISFELKRCKYYYGQRLRKDTISFCVAAIPWLMSGRLF